jgi:hypothetical protein
LTTSPQTDSIIKVHGRPVVVTFSGRGYWTLRCGEHVVTEQLPDDAIRDGQYEDLLVDAAFDRAYRKMKTLLK